MFSIIKIFKSSTITVNRQKYFIQFDQNPIRVKILVKKLDHSNVVIFKDFLRISKGYCLNMWQVYNNFLTMFEFSQNCRSVCHKLKSLVFGYYNGQSNNLQISIFIQLCFKSIVRKSGFINKTFSIM